MPMDRKRYPPNWNQLAFQIKQNANWCCEKCDRPCRQPGESWEKLEARLGEQWSLYETIDDDEFGFVEVPKFQRFTLTVAHLNHIPEDCRPENLKAWCSVCHLKYDAVHHARSAKANRYKKREAVGQLTFF